MMSWRWQKVGLLLGWLVISGLGGCSLGKSEEKIAKKAKEFTVIIDGCGAGSGAIIKREGNTYSVLTAYHVVEKSWTCLIFTSDQESYQVRGNTITQPVPEVDLGVLTFTSDKSYPVAKLGNSEKMVEATSVLVVGAPGIIGRIKTRTLLFNWGKIIGRVPQPKDGYSLIYDANTEPGMSGGPVLNNRGEIVGVHGQGDRDENNIKTGWNLGIPIQIFLNPESYVSVKQQEEKTANDYYNQGVTNYDLKKYDLAIADYNQAIALDPNYAAAYNGRGNAYKELKKYELAIADFNQAIALDQNYASAYVGRGLAYYDLKKYDLAIADYTESLRLNNSEPWLVHNNRGLAYYYLKKYELAIADYNKAIALDPN
ncbi:tetratricopeptide repeat-containing serine protease family protein, partial [Planktothricoides sp. SR001]|uniref:tetratricopeptide repeat-containing S1 family peptidase n=1 Tax=Planktothricoides sp. SR001 TaxID=1705388 RepID=UPI0012E118EE